MSEMRNPIKRNAGFNHPSGNVMTELQEADLNKFVAGAGETRDSGGVLCTSRVLSWHCPFLLLPVKLSDN